MRNEIWKVDVRVKREVLCWTDFNNPLKKVCSSKSSSSFQSSNSIVSSAIPGRIWECETTLLKELDAGELKDKEKNTDKETKNSKVKKTNTQKGIVEEFVIILN